MRYQQFFPIDELSSFRRLSERALSLATGLSRNVIRRIKAGEQEVLVESMARLAKYFEQELTVLSSPSNMHSEFSTVAASLYVKRDGFQSWKIHFMNLVDEFRRTLDARLILLPPPSGFDKKLTALLASIVTQLCTESKISIPGWAQRSYFLEIPWFVSEIESLKATALKESPLAFRKNNIFVHDNFLVRA